MFKLDVKVTYEVEQYIENLKNMYYCKYMIEELKNFGDCDEELKAIKEIQKLLNKEMKKKKDHYTNIEAVKTLYNAMVLKYSN